MKSKFNTIFGIAFFACINVAFSQEISIPQKQDVVRSKNDLKYSSPQWRKDNYIVNRDSAFANPYYAIQKLRGGNRRFVEGRSIYPRQDAALIKKLADGQSPFALIVGCSDSRVSAEILFDQGFGDLFITRTAGQVMTDASYGTIEYADLMLKTKLIVVLGHTNCGAVKAAVEHPENLPGHISQLIHSIKRAADTASVMKGNVLDNAIRLNVINQVEELRNLDPVLKKNYNDGKILIIGAVYDLQNGKVTYLDETLKNLPKSSYSQKKIEGL